MYMFLRKTILGVFHHSLNIPGFISEFPSRLVESVLHFNLF